VANHLLTNPVQRRIWSLDAGQFNIIPVRNKPTHGAAYFYGQNRSGTFDNLQKGAIKRGYTRKPDTILQERVETQAFPSSRSGFLLWRLRISNARPGQHRRYNSADLGGPGDTEFSCRQRSVRQIWRRSRHPARFTKPTVNGTAIPLGNLQFFAPDFFNEHDFQTKRRRSFHEPPGRAASSSIAGAKPTECGLAGPAFTGAFASDTKS